VVERRPMPWEQPSSVGGLPQYTPPGTPGYNPFAVGRPSTQQAAELSPMPPVARQIAHQASPVQDATRSRAEAAADFAHDVAYGRSDWQRAGRAIVGSDQYEDASAGRRAAAVVGGVALGGLALASWIPGFNVFKPAQAARAARAFGTGAAEGARAGTGVLRGGWDEASDLERARRAQRAADKSARSAPPADGQAPTPSEAIRLTPRGYDPVDPIVGQPNPVSAVDSGVQSAVRQDPIFSAQPFPLLQISPVPNPLDGSPVWRLGGAEVPQNIQHAILGAERSGILIPNSIKQDLAEKYRSSFISISDNFDPSRIAAQLTDQIDELGQWSLAAETLGRSNLYHPLKDASNRLDPEDVARALRTRLRHYVDTNNIAVTDSFIEDLIQSGLQITDNVTFNTRSMTQFASVMSEIPLQNVIAAPESALDNILVSGAFYNQFMTMSSRGLLSPKSRIVSELSTNGVLPSAGPFSRPVYGYAAIDNGILYENFIDSLDEIGRYALGATSSSSKYSILQVGKGAVNHYGNVHFVFTPESASRSAFTLGDSLGAQRVAAPLRNPSPGNLGLAGQNFGFGPEPYIETQTIAPRFQDIQLVRLTRPIDSSELANLKAKLRSLTGTDVPVYVQ